MVKLEGKQQEVLALPATGHIVVLGTAGSGITTIAMYRAIHLSKMPNAGKVLLVTFNGALVEYMHRICHTSSDNLVVESYHKFARGYLNSRGLMSSNCILNKKDTLVEKAILELQQEYPKESTFKRSKQFFIEEISFIQKFGFSTYEEYRLADRIGRRKANIKRENRQWVYKAYQRYIELREKIGKRYDWDDLAIYVYNELLKDCSERRYKHIIVDEGQDFSPMMIKSLNKAMGSGGSFSFFGDVAQQIYGSRLSWRDSGIEVKKIWRFEANYRNPISIVKFAKAITENNYCTQDADMVEMHSQIAEGPNPSLLHFERIDAERQWIVNQAIEIGKVSSIAIVCRSRSDLDTFYALLHGKHCNAVEINKDTPGFASEKKVYLTTYHAAKGLEFENVIIPYLSSDRFPDPDIVKNSLSLEDTYADELKLLFVAATRSKYGLYMTYSKELSPLFPQNSEVYDFFTEEDLQ
jgi:superfamily I DNA/RNA helicase